MREITVEELKAKMEDGSEFHLLDVREPAEYQEYNMGGKLFPLGNIVSMQVEDLEDWKNDEIVIHCKAGSRSMQACMVLEQLGFTNVVNVKGGALAWQEKYGDQKVK